MTLVIVNSSLALPAGHEVVFHDGAKFTALLEALGLRVNPRSQLAQLSD